MQGMDGQLLASPNGSYVWKAPDLIFNSSAAKCADRLPEQATNSKLWELERKKNGRLSAFLSSFRWRRTAKLEEQWSPMQMGWDRKGWRRDGFVGVEFDKQE